MRTRQGIVPSYNAQTMIPPVANGEGVTGLLVTASGSFAGMKNNRQR